MGETPAGQPRQTLLERYLSEMYLRRDIFSYRNAPLDARCYYRIRTRAEILHHPLQLHRKISYEKPGVDKATFCYVCRQNCTRAPQRYNCFMPRNLHVPACERPATSSDVENEAQHDTPGKSDKSNRRRPSDLPQITNLSPSFNSKDAAPTTRANLSSRSTITRSGRVSRHPQKLIDEIESSIQKQYDTLANGQNKP